MVSSLDLLKNSNTLPKTVTGNQAITENQCSFPDGGPVGKLGCLETVQEAWLFFKACLFLPVFVWLGITPSASEGKSINQYSQPKGTGVRYYN